MDHLSLAPIDVVAPVAALVLAVVGGIAIIYRSTLLPVLSTLLGVLAGATLLGCLVIFAPALREPAIAAQIEERYGIELTTEQVRALEYPRLRPTEDTEQFGSVGIVTGDVSTMITLRWVGERLILVDGEGVPLPATGG